MIGHAHLTCIVYMYMYMYCRSHMCFIEFYYMAGSASGQDGPLLPTQNSRFVHAKAKLFSVILHHNYNKSFINQACQDG